MVRILYDRFIGMRLISGVALADRGRQSCATADGGRKQIGGEGLVALTAITLGK
jgi:hypothetical protein